MDIVNDTQKIYDEVNSLNPFVVFLISFIGLMLTLFFVYIFRNSLIESYGKQIYLWFFVLIALNLVNILFITGYYQTRYKNIVGKPGFEGDIGDLGSIGQNTTCSYCSNESELGIQYTDKYYLISKISKTTNIVGEISLWRSVGMLGLSSLGDTVFSQKNQTKLRTYMAGFGSQPPKDFKKINEISDGVNRITLWEPIPPKGYSFLGHFATIGSTKPNVNIVACLPSTCLIQSYNFLYVASFPSIDIIPSYTKTPIKFCSFWQTQLNHMICKVSDAPYITNSVYYNIVQGHPEYYDIKNKSPIQDKIIELEQMLKNKPSVIYHMQKDTVKGVKFNPIFVDSKRNPKGKVIELTVNAKPLNTIMNNIPTMENFISYFMDSLIYINKLIQENDSPLKFNNDSNMPGKTAFITLKRLIEKTKKNENAFNTVIIFCKIFKANPAITMKAFQDEKKTFGVTTNNYIDMTIEEKTQNFLNILNIIEISEINTAITKLKSIGIEAESQLGLFDIYAKKKSAEKEASYSFKEEPNPENTLYDDLFYLFPMGFNDQISATEEDSLDGGFYLDNIENRQRKNFINYIRTFTKPITFSYSFKKNCIMFIETDPERNQIITDLLKIYNMVGATLENITNLGTCDSPSKITKLYNNLMIRIDKQFKMIDGYNEKIANQEFSYFATSRLKWLLNEMNNYYRDIKDNCKSDERSILNNKIRNDKTRLWEDFKYTVDFEKYKLEIENINTIVDTMDTDELTVVQLKKIYEILSKNLSQKIKEVRNKKGNTNK
jgi:hypothetical protein